MDTPNKANMVKNLSKTEYCFVAETTPIGIAINVLKKNDPNDSQNQFHT